jgi:hypothetical protein
MNFSNVKVLSYEHKNNFWGDKAFRYGSTISISINGYILDLSNTSGVKDIFQSCKNLSDSLGAYQDIVIDNVNYGKGKITNVSFDSGNWVKVTEYTASIEIVGDGNLGSVNFTDLDFSNQVINDIKSNIQYVEEFNESYSIDYSSDQDSVSGVHSIDLKISTLFSGDKIDFVKNLASALFSKTFSENLSKITYSKPSENLRKDFYSENYDSISGACGFKRNFSYSNDSSCFSRNRSISVNFGEDGITTVSESNTIKGECMNSSLFDSAESGFSSEISGVFSRCNAAFTTYQTQFGSVDPLINKEIERSVKRNRFTGEIEYIISFTNDKRRKNLYTFEYVLDLSRSEDFIWSAVENGSVKGDGVMGSADRFNNALNGWNTEKAGINARVQSFYTSNAKIKPIPSVLNLINKNITHAPFEGLISYSYNYTDDSTLDMSSAIRRKSINITDSKATRIHNDFLIPGGVVKYAIAQAANQSKQGEREVAGSLEISSSTLPFKGNDYFQECVNLASSNKGTGTDLYLESFSFSSDEIEQNVEFNGKYKYSSAASSS